MQDSNNSWKPVLKIADPPAPHSPDRQHRAIDYDKVLKLGRELLIALGENPDDEGLADTPRRWASWWKEFIEYKPGTTETTFDVVTSDQLVVVSGMRVWSICEHHLLPMWCDISIGYIARQKVLGLSKFARIAHESAHKLQLQERLNSEIADKISRVTESPDVIVLATGAHLCMMMRGIKTDGQVSSLITRGVFAEKADLRADFLHLVDRKSSHRDIS